MKVKVKGIPKMEDGGISKVRVTGIPQAENGIQIYDGGGVVPISHNPYNGGMMQFHGNSHDQGGIKMSYGENPLEVEGSETAFIGRDNNLNILGNMKVPTMDKKFKTVGKEIGEQEAKAGKQLDTASGLINTQDPYNKFQAFAFNSGRVMQEGANIKQKDLAQQKEDLSTIQNWMLETADKTGVKPKELSKMLKNGGSIPIYADGGSQGDGSGDNTTSSSSVAVRHNNPGNLKYAPWQQKYGAVPGDPSTDGGRFAKFPDTTSGLNAMQALLKSPTYKNLPVKDAIKKWTGGSGYNISLGDIANKKVGELAPDEFGKLKNTITYGEDGKYYDNTPVSTAPIKPLPYQDIQPIPVRDTISPIQPAGNAPGNLNPVDVNEMVSRYKPDPGFVTPQAKKMTSLADRNKLGISDILPELAGLAERPTPVPHQQYNPQLFTPYNVSFQDRLNQNNATFKAVEDQVHSNPSALAALAAQKYSADNAVQAEQFRTNQGIQNEVTNKNIGLLNDAKLKNLQFADTENQRQTAAETYTKQHQREALASLASKIAQNRRENNTIRLEENRFNYRPDQNMNLQYQGPDANFAPGSNIGLGASGNSSNIRTEIERDPSGNIIGSKEIHYGGYRDAKEQYQAEIDRKKAMQTNIQKYGGKTPIKLKKKAKK